MKRVILFLAAVLLLPGVVAAYQNPGKPTGFVNDFTKTLTAQEKVILETKLSEYTASSGNEIAIAIVPTIGDDSIENYAVKLFEDWQIGRKGVDNGVLLVVALNDRQMRIEVGYGLEPYLTDIEASRLIQTTLLPAFKNGDYFSGLDQATDLIIKKLSGETAEAFTVTPRNPVPDYGTYLTLGIFGLLFLTRLFAQSRSWWLGGAIGVAAGIGISIFFGFMSAGLIAFLVLIPLGLIVDFIFSRIGPGGGPGGLPGMGSWGGSSGGGFGGFGGGSSGGGGASGRW